ncbi:MAG: SbcC/MukB-like Walker B domain-containing protein [Mariniphaga sp.]
MTIQGLFSYQEKQVIDFQKLTEAHLFGIFGSVGSGKSSILDAITFALYGETERMNSRDNRNYNMMNLKSDQLFIEFDFSAKDGTTYRSVVKGRRNSKKFDDVKTFERGAYKISNGMLTPIEIDELQRVIGLSYENFKRTIIIPQGKFQEFLQLGNKDRTQMMKELFNLEKFELFYKVVALETKNSKQIQMLQGQLVQLGEVKPEQLDAAQLRLKEILSDLELLKNQLIAKQDSETGFKQLKALSDKLKEQQNTFELLQKKEPELLNSEEQLKAFEFCVANYKNLFERSDETAKGINQLKDTIGKEDQVLRECISRLEGLEAGFVKLQSQYDKRDQLQLEASELKKIGRIIELNNDNKLIAERVRNGEETCERSEYKIKEFKSQVLELTESLTELKSQLPDLNILAKVKDWFTVHKTYHAASQEYTKEIESIQNEVKLLTNNSLLNVQNLYPEIFGQSRELSELSKLLSQKGAAIKEEITEREKSIEHLLIRVKLEDFATNLEEGKPCPLCGSLEHPDLLAEGDLKNVLKSERVLKSKHESAKESVDKLIISLGKTETQVSLKQESIQKLKLKRIDINEKLVNHQSQFMWPEFENEQVLQNAFKAAETIQSSIKLKESLLQKNQAESEKEQTSLENYRKKLDEIREQRTINQSEIKTLTGQLEIIEIEKYLALTVREVNHLSDNLLLQLAEIESSYRKTQTEISLLQQKREASMGKLETNRITLEREQVTFDDIKAKIEQLLADSQYASVDQVKAILDLKLNVEAERQKIQDFRQKLQLSINQLELLKIEIGDRTYVLEDHLKLQEELMKLKGEMEAKNREFGITDGEIRKLQKDLEQQKDIRKNLDQFELRAEDLKTLKKLFTSNGFVNYVSSVHLQNLCLAANERFYKLVRQKMSLELADDNTFQVRDFMNGGKVRSVKTLSGGQTFQAALSLALALADSIQNFTDSAQNFFFLDEGFGSLDKDSLDIVFDTLKSLRKENRIVGVISHVEEMQQEIDTHLRIVNHEERGSLINVSWE